MRAAFKYLVALFFAGVVAQIGLAGVGAFHTVSKNDDGPLAKEKAGDWFGAHAAVGYLLVLISLLLLLIALRSARRAAAPGRRAALRADDRPGAARVARRQRLGARVPPPHQRARDLRRSPGCSRRRSGAPARGRPAEVTSAPRAGGAAGWRTDIVPGVEDYTNKYKGEQVEIALFGGEYQDGVLTAYCYPSRTSPTSSSTGTSSSRCRTSPSLHCSSRCDAPEPDWPPRGLAEDDPDHLPTTSRRGARCETAS